MTVRRRNTNHPYMFLALTSYKKHGESCSYTLLHMRMCMYMYGVRGPGRGPSSRSGGCSCAGRALGEPHGEPHWLSHISQDWFLSANTPY